MCVCVCGGGGGGGGERISECGVVHVHVMELDSK